MINILTFLFRIKLKFFSSVFYIIIYFLCLIKLIDMRTNVTYLEQTYNINPDKGKVYCKLKFGINLNKIEAIKAVCNLDEYNNFINDLTNNYTGIASIEFKYDKNYDEMLVFETGGLAKCSDNDNFDAELGKKLASTKAQRSAFRIAKDFYRFIQKILLNYLCNNSTLIYNCDVVADKCKQHEFDLTK